MSAPLAPPPRKDPTRRTRLPTLPPHARSREGLWLTAVATGDGLSLQVCEDCGRIHYPPQQICAGCLGDGLAFRAVNDRGALLADTVLHHSNDLYFRERLPWRLGSVALECGPTVIAHLHGDCVKGTSVRVRAGLDRAGQAVMVAVPEKETKHMADDRVLRETTCDPRHRRVLITDAKSAVGQSLARAFLRAGAREVYLGDPQPWKPDAGFDDLREQERTSTYDLDVTNGDQLHDVASRIGAKVEILVNTSYHLRAGGATSRKDVNAPRDEMDVNYFGLLRLAREFGPVMSARGADGEFGATAWVNLLSIYALASHPDLVTYSASMAAAAALARSLRGEMYAGGVRVVNVFPGPIEDEWQQLLPPPKLAPDTLARAVLDALARGAEDVYPGAVAREIHARWHQSPKEVERQISL